MYQVNIYTVFLSKYNRIRNDQHNDPDNNISVLFILISIRSITQNLIDNLVRSLCNYVSVCTKGQQTTVSPIGPDELPPPFYQNSGGGGVPMVTCRVCQAMIDISGKRDQHVVKCCQCNEATVSVSTG